MIKILTKLMPTVVKTIGWKGALELLLGASFGAEVLNLGIDKTKELLTAKLGGKMEVKQRELLEKRAKLLEEKAKAGEIKKVTVIENEEEAVDEKSNKASKKSK